MEKEKFDWLRFWLHFLFGAVLGFVMSFSVFDLAFEFSNSVTWALTLITTLSIAILGGLYGDPFWTRLLESRLFRFLFYWG